ncbi:hypothetical protein BDV95DRAFT_239731 [Massariosphaeria phaeospora]|uniref:Uncharacterized protein n=1 Tax=Massariosphaeria phaeospora TaxID=100035 RepID=A0A7C8I1V6_9PLEO|nr:hypothetical protein BDV95DRAFT_239731 [Massariosphaeria phaeospora]
MNASATNSAQSPFLRLPVKLRNRIYRLLLVNTRSNDRVIHANDLARRKERRENIISIRHGAGFVKAPSLIPLPNVPTYPTAPAHHFLHLSPANDDRIMTPVTGVSPLLETGIFLSCRQTWAEGLQIMYSENTFAVIVAIDDPPKPFDTLFPPGVNFQRIQRLRIEIQVGNPSQRRLAPVSRSTTWHSFRLMYDLEFLQIIVTFNDGKNSLDHAGLFNRCWHNLTLYSEMMQSIIVAIPKDIDVKWGLTKAQKASGDYGGHFYAKGCVLRKIAEVYGGLRGVDLEIDQPEGAMALRMLNKPPAVQDDGMDDGEDIYGLPIDGD